jgi:hypothetical protein
MSLNESVGAGGQRVRHFKRRSVSFEDDLPGDRGAGAVGGASGGKGREIPVDANMDVEERRRERRRSEAKAAIEVGCLFVFCLCRCLMTSFFSLLSAVFLFSKLTARQCY